MTKALNKNYYKNKTVLTKKELQLFKNRLEEKKIKIEKNLNITAKELNTHNNDTLKDEGDYASQSLEISTNNAILQEQVKTLKQIERSLLQIEAGTYGICNLCEEPINKERLKVKIFAENCVVCREFLEKQR
jgi:DnaK suppressor protein